MSDEYNRSDTEYVRDWQPSCEAEIRADERAKTIDEVKEKIKSRLIDNLALDNATKYGNENAKQQANSYATVMKYEIADCVNDLIDDLEEMKGVRNE